MASAKSNVKLLGTAKKIESPLAKYNSAGQLTCVVCNTVVKSEMVWTAHVNGRQHRENVASLKKTKVDPQFTKPLAVPAVKRKADSVGSSNLTSASPSKKGVPADFFDNHIPVTPSVSAPIPIKSILKNSSKTQHVSTPEITNRVNRVVVSASVDQMETDDGTELPHSSSSNQTQSLQQGASTCNQLNAIPEGFFDDPKLDAKVRHIEYKDPVEEEWSKFQKEINEEVTASVAIQEEDQEESTAERQLEEIEEQMLKWGRVLELEQKKELYGQRVRALRESMMEEKEESSSEEDDMEMDKFFDWRSKAT